VPTALLLSLFLGAAAQEPTHAPAATQPSPGHFFSKTRLILDTWQDGIEGEALSLQQTLIAGVARDWSVGVEVTATDREPTEASGAEDLRGWLAWRFHRRDLGPVDTQRASVLVGASFPTGAESLTQDEVAPQLGIVFTDIRGRNGVNLAAFWEFHGEAAARPLYAGDAGAGHFRLDAAWVWRVAPAAFGPEYGAAHYLQTELRWDLETNGDRELRVAPGWLLEAPRYALECSVEIPVAERLSFRPERGWSAIAGVRFLF
jgi:hypothetical protein